MILSDYGKGVLSAAIIGHVIAQAGSAGIPVFVDPKTDDFSRYRGATCITPNTQELATASGMAVDSDAAVEAAARKVLADAGAAAILATRSERGMMLVEADGPTHSVPARAREVFDVSGAGDTVIAAMALAHASGLSLSQSMHIANAAAGVVVSKLGTATATVDEVLHELEGDEPHRRVAGCGPAAAGGDAGPRGALERPGAARRLHPWLLRHHPPRPHRAAAAARAECDRLVVGLDADDGASRHGPRPGTTCTARAQVMARDRLCRLRRRLHGTAPADLIRHVAPDVLVNGTEERAGPIIGADIVQAAGGRVVLTTRMPDDPAGQAEPAT